MFQIMVIIGVLKIIMLQLSWSSFLLFLRVRGLVPVVYKGLPIIQDNHIPYIKVIILFSILVLKIFMLLIILVIMLLLLVGLVPVVYKGLPLENKINPIC